MWHHTKQGDRYVTVVIDLTPVRDRSGPAQLLDMVPGRSKKAIQDLALPARPGLAWAGRGGSHGAVSPGSRAPPARSSHRPERSWTPTRVVALTCGKLDQCRQRIQQAITGRRGRAGDRLYRAGRTLLTGAGLLTDAQGRASRGSVR